MRLAFAAVNVNKSAPVVAAARTEIEASPETVWDVLTNVEGWPSWNPEVKSVSLEGELAEGSVFRWKAGPASLTSTIGRVDPPRLIGWTGKTMTLNAVHVWRLEPSHGGTLVTTEESWEGLLARVLRGRLQKTLQKSLASGLGALKAEVEKRAPR